MQVSLLLPGCSSVPNGLKDVVESFNSFYLLRNLPVHELLDKDFLESAVYRGNSRQGTDPSAADTSAIYPVHTILCLCVCR